MAARQAVALHKEPHQFEPLFPRKDLTQTRARERCRAAFVEAHRQRPRKHTRGEFQQMTSLGERVARSLLSRLLATGLAASDGLYAPVRFALPLDSLQFLFPDLYPEAAAAPGS